MLGKRRQMIFAPEVNPNSFVFFFQKGDDGSLRWTRFVRQPEPLVKV